MGHQKKKAKGAQSFGFWEICNAGNVDRQNLFCLNTGALSNAWDRLSTVPGFFCSTAWEGKR
jgi:hypothetical protein